MAKITEPKTPSTSKEDKTVNKLSSLENTIKETSRNTNQQIKSLGSDFNKTIGNVAKSLEKQSEANKRIAELNKDAIKDLISAVKSLERTKVKLSKPTKGQQTFENDLQDTKLSKEKIFYEKALLSLNTQKAKDELTVQRAANSLAIQTESFARLRRRWKEEDEQRYRESYKERTLYKMASAVKEAKGGDVPAAGVAALTGGMINPVLARLLGMDKALSAFVSGTTKFLMRKREDTDSKSSAIKSSEKDEVITRLDTIINLSKAKKENSQKIENEKQSSGIFDVVKKLAIFGMIAGIGYKIYTNWEKIKEFFDKFTKNLPTWLEMAGNKIKSVINKAIGFITNTFNSIVKKFSDWFQVIKDKIEAGIGSAVKFIDGVKQTLVDLTYGLGEGLINASAWVPDAIGGEALRKAGESLTSLTRDSISAEKKESVEKELKDKLSSGLSDSPKLYSAHKSLEGNALYDGFVGAVESGTTKILNFFDKRKNKEETKPITPLPAPKNNTAITPIKNQGDISYSDKKLYGKSIPTEYVENAERLGKKYGIDPNLMLSQVQAESNFNKNARGTQGEIGSTQFMPATWAIYGKGLDSTTVAGQMEAQAKYLQALSKTFDGDTEKMIAAYNAGEGRVQQAEKLAAKNNTTWQEELANLGNFQNTLNYVDKIHKNQYALNNQTPLQKNYKLETNDLPPAENITTAAATNNTNNNFTDLFSQLFSSIENSNKNQVSSAPIIINNTQQESRMPIYAVGDIARTLAFEG